MPFKTAQVHPKTRLRVAYGAGCLPVLIAGSATADPEELLRQLESLLYVVEPREIRYKFRHASGTLTLVWVNERVFVFLRVLATLLKQISSESLQKKLKKSYREDRKASWAPPTFFSGQLSRAADAYYAEDGKVQHSTFPLVLEGRDP